jgi:hypothetical protein
MNQLAERVGLTVFTGIQVKSEWKWRDKKGYFHAPRKMETRHLFCTLRMIWNNFMEPSMRVGKVRLYQFNPYYTRRYFAEAIVVIGRELQGRNDLTAQWKDELQQMASHLRGHDLCVWS